MLRLTLAWLVLLALAMPGAAQDTASETTQRIAQNYDDDDDDFLFFEDDEESEEAEAREDEVGEVDETDDVEGGSETPSPADTTRDQGPESEGAGPDALDDFQGPSDSDLRKSVGIEEILVTSQRRRSTLQDVPVSVTAFTASEIEAQGIQDIKGISQYTPNLEIKTAFAASNPTLFIRGVGLNDYNANAASSVAVYQDEVYMNSPAGQLFQFFDVQGVEVLRGPQGSLYGRNASAGAIRVTSVEPTEDFDLVGTVTYGRFNEAEVETAVGGGIVDGLISGRAAFHYRRRDGWMKNHCSFDEPTPITLCGMNSRDTNIDGIGIAARNPLIPAGLPRRLNDVNNWAGRGLLRVTPDFLDMDWLFNIHGGQNLSQTTALFHAGNLVNVPQRKFLDAKGFPNPSRFGFTNDDPFAGYYNRVGYEFLDTLGASARGTMAFGPDVIFTTTTAYESAKREVTDDFDSSPFSTSHNDTNDKSWQFSEELRADWIAGDNLNFTFGGMYMHASLDADNLFRVRATRDPATGIDTWLQQFTQTYQQKLDTFGLYGHFVWRFLDDFSLEGGVRYSWERKDFAIQGSVIRQNSGEPVDTLAQANTATFSAPTGDLSLSYHLTEDATVYGKYSRGWKPGGFNGSVVTSINTCTPESCPLTEPIRPESVDGWEMGVKSYWFDRRLMVNAALFFQKYQDLQVFVLENTNLTSTPLPKLINADDAEIYGAEIEVWTRPIPGMDIRTQFGWLESKYLNFTRNFFRQNPGVAGRPGTIQVKEANFTGNRLVANPRFSWSGDARYEISLGDDKGYLRPGFTWSFKTLTFFDPTEGRDRGGSARWRSQWAGNTFLGQPSLWLLDARLTYTTPDERFEITGWVRNLANTAYSIDAFSNLEGRDARYAVRVIGVPRTFGITASFSY